MQNLRQILQQYEINVFRLEQPDRFNRLLHFIEHIHSFEQSLRTHKHTHLPFLLCLN